MPNKSFIHSEHFKTTLFLFVLVIFILFCFLMFLPFIKAIGWALALTIIAYPIYSFIGKKIKNKNICAFLSCAIVVLLILIPAIFLLTLVTQEAVQLTKNIETFISCDNISHIQKYLKPGSGFAKIITNFVGKYVNLSNFPLESNINSIMVDLTKKTGAIVGKQSLIIAKNIALSVFWILLVLIITFFLLKDGEKILKYIRTFIPLDEEQKNLAFKKVDESIKATIYGWLVIGLAQGFLLGLMFFILRLDSPVLWGAVTFLVSFVPLIGAPGVWLPASIILLIKGMYVKGIILFLWGMLVVSTADNILRPIFVGTKLHLHIMLTFFAIFGGLLLMGPLGLIMGPVIFAVTINLLDILKQDMEEKNI